MSSSSVHCAGCGAPLPAALAPTRHVCAYCGQEQLIGPRAAPMPPPQPPAPPPYPYYPVAPFPPPRPASNRGAGLAIAIALLVLVAGGTATQLLMRGASRGGSTSSGPGGGGVTPPGEHLQWSPSGEGPSVLAVGDLNGDGIEEVVGRYRLLDSAGGTILYVGAFDGKTLERIWAAGPFGTLQQGVTSTAIAVASGHVVVTDYRSTAHILDLRTGKELSSATLSDKAKSACSPHDARSEVWLELVDRKHVVLDTATGKLTPGPRPKWCAPLNGTACSGHGGFMMDDGPCGVSMTEMSSFKDFSAQMMLHGGSVDVLFGTKTPGTPVATALGLDPKTRAVRWRTTLAPDPAVSAPFDFAAATLEGGRVVTTYSTTAPDTLHVVTFDAATGAKQVDVPLPHTIGADTPGLITVSAQRAYVPHWTWLDVVDLHAGKVVGTIGIW